ncbi:F-box protein CPR30-like [Chenopodium quinoa]|uniref:F-box protein CPR30-like n=1 Tax=Chenopodium quinoa TaxID=63459 RepID=UPI000B77386F|nr:F-box protein CPR30-like [Chenopodium quinoa]
MATPPQSPPENADKETQNREIPMHIISRETQNRETQSSETQNRETQSSETQYRETQNRETQSSETQNRETQSSETQNRETQNKEIQSSETQNRETQSSETQNRETQSSETQNREIPMDIIFTEILPRLPAKSLLRFRLVCKEWQLFISSSQFIINHTRHPNYLSSRSVLSIALNSSLTYFDYGDSQNVQINNFGRYSMTNPVFLIGSCNGLVLLIFSHARNGELLFPSDLLNFGFEYSVYNPVLQLDIVIPQPLGFVLRSDYITAKDYSFGFGCVSTHDRLEFFIVAISFRMGNVAVFESSTGIWDIKTLQRNLPIVFQDAWYVHSGTLVNEALHWGVIIVGENIKCIASFDLVSQLGIKFMRLPYANFGEPSIIRSAFSLCRINDRLCAWAYYNGGHVVDMWMLKEYDVWESWTRFSCGDLSCEYRYFFGLTKAREIMMFHFRWLVLIDFSRVPHERRVVHFGHQVTAVNYVQSLVSPHTVFLYGEQNG